MWLQMLEIKTQSTVQKKAKKTSERVKALLEHDQYVGLCGIVADCRPHPLLPSVRNCKMHERASSRPV